MKLIRSFLLIMVAMGALASIPASAFSLATAKKRVVTVIKNNQRPLIIIGALAATALVVGGIVGCLTLYNSKKGIPGRVSALMDSTDMELVELWGGVSVNNSAGSATSMVAAAIPNHAANDIPSGFF